MCLLSCQFSFLLCHFYFWNVNKALKRLQRFFIFILCNWIWWILWRVVKPQRAMASTMAAVIMALVRECHLTVMCMLKDMVSVFCFLLYANCLSYLFGVLLLGWNHLQTLGSKLHANLFLTWTDFISDNLPFFSSSIVNNIS